MPPVRPKLRNDGPTCRVCGCSQNNACVDDSSFVPTMGCSWVQTRGADAGPLCSACAGTDGDMGEALKRLTDLLNKAGPPRRLINQAHAIGLFALRRYRARKRASKGLDAPH